MKTPLIALALVVIAAQVSAQQFTGPDAPVTLTPLEQQQIKDVCGIAMATSAANTEQRFGIATACVALKAKIESAALEQFKADEAKRKAEASKSTGAPADGTQAQRDHH